MTRLQSVSSIKIKLNNMLQIPFSNFTKFVEKIKFLRRQIYLECLTSKGNSRYKCWNILVMTWLFQSTYDDLLETLSGSR